MLFKYLWYLSDVATCDFESER